MKTKFAALLIILSLTPDFGAAAKPPSPVRPPPRPPSPPKPPAPPPNLRIKNGIRLVGGSGPRGRLEVSSKNAWFSPPGGKKVGWSPVCDSVDFTDEIAQTMCIMLGYKYGRKYFNPSLAYVNSTTNATPSEPPYNVGRIYCDANGAPPRRLLGTAGGTAARTADRSLFSMPRSFIASPKTAPFICYFYTGGPCGATGPLAGIECSHWVMSPAPPPPPSPPLPPPGISSTIRMVGGPGINMIPRDSVTEANLCAASDLCPMFGRFDVQVESPDGSGTKIWAPLCAPEDPDVAQAVGSIACGQVYDWPKGLDGGVEIVLSQTADSSFPIPAEGGAVPLGDFDPAAVPAWVTVTGASKSDIISVQDFDYTVSTKRCPSGGLLAVSCQAWGEARRRV